MVSSSLVTHITEEALVKKGFVSPDDVLRLPRITESGAVKTPSISQAVKLPDSAPYQTASSSHQ
uniref:Uncharacterized protein n=1 Tax=Timema poppense TaxID=170557 RepID=A0A7R9CWH2_TIMPO|nr:unnamed protein product [Timema poppensis]